VFGSIFILGFLGGIYLVVRSSGFVSEDAVYSLSSIENGAQTTQPIAMTPEGSPYRVNLLVSDSFFRAFSGEESIVITASEGDTVVWRQSRNFNYQLQAREEFFNPSDDFGLPVGHLSVSEPQEIVFKVEIDRGDDARQKIEISRMVLYSNANEVSKVLVILTTALLMIGGLGVIVIRNRNSW
jgi:hypothetical protein